MGDLIKITLIGTFFGTFGTTIGGIIGVFLKNTTNKFLSFILELAAGLMMGIVCFDLIPEAINISNIANVIIGIVLGVITMIICDNLLTIRFNKKTVETMGTNSLLKTGIIIGIGLAIHNLPEGLAIGSAYGASIRLGISLALAIALHDIPEGISMSVPMKNGGMKKTKVILYTILSGLTTGIGAFVGRIVGGISTELVSISLSFAAGAMLYIVSGELVPESYKLYKGRLPYIGYIIGILLGIIATII